MLDTPVRSTFCTRPLKKGSLVVYAHLERTVPYRMTT